MIVTGSDGFIGGALVRAAIAAGHRVTPIGAPLVGEQVRLEASDGVLAHLGALPGIVESIEDPMQCFLANTAGTLEYLSAAVDNRLDRFLFASSCAATQPPTHPYGASKAAAEAWCWAYTSTYDLRVLILRLSNVYGPGSQHKGSVVAAFCRDALTEGVITIHGDGRQMRDFIHVDDVVSAFLAAAYCDPAYVGCVNIATGTGHTINELAEIIAANTGCRIQYADRRPGDVPASQLEATANLPWRAEVDFERGVLATLDYFKETLAQ